MSGSGAGEPSQYPVCRHGKGRAKPVMISTMRYDMRDAGREELPLQHIRLER